ncbi:MAG TPA: ornithine--oxo-acid transaminase [Planctomycetota bacterium]|nr:ornithine--oxo-acid transaminase [Planctomycetota bacterium]
MTVSPTNPTADELLALEHRYAAHNYHPLPVVLARGQGAFVWDVDGRRYLDCLAAYSAVNQGHNHPRIVKALTDQAQRLALTSRAFHNDRFGPFCEKLCTLIGYDKVLLMNAGAEAVETAIKAARRWGYRHKAVPEHRAEILVFEGNFHGRTTTIVGFSSDAASRDGFGPFAPGFRSVPFGDLEAAAAAMTPHTVAVLVEPIQGEAGVVIPPPSFLPGLRTLCDERRALLICDEIQSGLGRAGALLCHRDSGVRADAVVLGKALSGGLYPISAFAAGDEVMAVFTPGSHGSTFGGNPLACAVGEAALDVLVDEDLCERSRTLGSIFAERLRALRSPKIEQVRARGLWVGVQLTGAAGGARRYCERLLDEGFLCKDTHGHTIRIAPPLVVEAADLERIATALARVLE